MIDSDLDVFDVLALYRIAVWLVLAFVTWRWSRRLYPAQQAIVTMNALVFALMGISALIHGIGTDRAGDLWLAYIVTPFLTAVAVASFAAWREKRKR